MEKHFHVCGGTCSRVWHLWSSRVPEVPVLHTLVALLSPRRDPQLPIQRSSVQIDISLLLQTISMKILIFIIITHFYKYQ